MLSRVYSIATAGGLHARPAAAILKQAQALGCQLFVKTLEEPQWHPAGIVNLLLAAAAGNGVVELGVEGEQAKVALEAIASLLTE